MAIQGTAIYSPVRRGLPMTYAYTRPLPRVLLAATTGRLTRTDRLLIGRLRPFMLAALAVKGFFKA